MTTLLLAIVAFLMAPWVFWSLAFGATYWVYYLVESDKDSERVIGGASFLSLLLVGALIYRYPELRAINWQTWLYIAGGYVAWGLVTMSIKWVLKLRDFKRRASTWLTAYVKEHGQFETSHGARLKSLMSHLYHDSYGDKVIEEGPKDARTYRLNHRAWPLATWATFWPWFALSVVFDMLKSLVDQIIAMCGRGLTALSKAFSVS